VLNKVVHKREREREREREGETYISAAATFLLPALFVAVGERYLPKVYRRAGRRAGEGGGRGSKVI
jgi:hypothetical protein